LAGILLCGLQFFLWILSGFQQPGTMTNDLTIYLKATEQEERPEDNMALGPMQPDAQADESVQIVIVLGPLYSHEMGELRVVDEALRSQRLCRENVQGRFVIARVFRGAVRDR